MRVRFKITSPIGKIVLSVFVIVIATLSIFYLFTDEMEHIEDTNGTDNYALAVITDENIINQDIGALNIWKSTGMLDDGITFKSKQFTGVYRVFVTNFLFDSDFLMHVNGFNVNSGNFRMCIVCDGEIIAEVEPGIFQDVLLHDLNGTFELVIAGESANFEFSLDRSFCEEYNITIDTID